MVTYTVYLDTAKQATSNLRTTVTANSMSVTWDAPSDKEVTGYTVGLLNINETKQTMSNPNITKATFSGLEAGTRYTVVVVTLVGNTENHTIKNTFYTSKSG